MSESRRHSKQFLAREDSGRVTLRMRFTSEEASLFEEAAGGTAIMTWIHETLTDAAEREVQAIRAELAALPPPE